MIVTLSNDALGPGGPGCLRWQLRDIGELRRIERALLAERQLLDSVIDAAEAMILLLDRESRVLRSNAFLHALTGLRPDELQGRFWYDVLVPPEQRPSLRRLAAQARGHGQARSGVVPMATRQGSPREVIWSARALPPGGAGAVVLVGHDVTALQEAQRVALQAERLATLGQVATGLAHEGRNALQRIQGCLSMLALRVGDSRQILDLIDRAQKAQDDLHHLFEDVRSYAADVKPQRITADLGAAWREAWDDVVSVPRAGGAKLVEDVGGEDLACRIDPFQIKRVFRNLFENSLAAGADQVRVTARSLPAAQGDVPVLELLIRDNGPGFAPEVRPRLFEPFFTTRTRGTGLGLAICRRLLKAHGGWIEAGAGGPGAEVRITLPRRSP